MEYLDWDLHAVVRGRTNDFASIIMEEDNHQSCYVPFEYASTVVEEDNQQSCFVPFDTQPNDLFSGFSNCFENTSVLDELEELYKPFYSPALLQPLSPQTINLMVSTISIPSDVKQPQDPQKQQQQQQPLIGSNVEATTSAPVSRRSRKNQHKRVVQQLTADDLSSDKWAWRKYGQKPIKASPYPRSYYRCSSSKSCLARKQVEQSNSDPAKFIVTYTAEHCHSQPIRRNSLAGTAKKKSSVMKNSHTTSDPETQTLDSCCSPLSTTSLSQSAPLMASYETSFCNMNASNIL